MSHRLNKFYNPEFIISASRKKNALVVGEVLFDKFPDGRSVLGGAPFNVAWNLQHLGQQPLFLSAVGTDSEADQIRQTMDQHGLDSSALQINEHPTGRVAVSFEGGEPAYDIVVDQAFDFIQPDVPHNSDLEISVIYHGSLIWRNPVSRASVQTLRSKFNAPVFVDLNIRLPWFDFDWVPEILLNADALKLNVDELSQLVDRPVTGAQSIETAAQELLAKYSLASAWVTAGKDGAYYFGDKGQVQFAPAIVNEDVVDTVGAGDAFSSAVINGVLLQQPPQLILQSAVRLAGRVCGLRGATTNDVGFYQI